MSPGRYDSRLFSQSTRCGSRVPVSKVWRSWLIFGLNSSSLIGERLMPTTANLSERKLAAARLYSAGISLRLARSPEAPKITRTHGGAGWRSGLPPAGGAGDLTVAGDGMALLPSIDPPPPPRPPA